MGIFEHEDRRTLHRIVDHGAFDAAAQVQHLHAAVVRRNQGALGGGQRDQEIALGVLAVDAERSGESQWHLGDPDEMLAVAVGHMGVKE